MPQKMFLFSVPMLYVKTLFPQEHSFSLCATVRISKAQFNALILRIPFSSFIMFFS